MSDYKYTEKVLALGEGLYVFPDKSMGTVTDAETVIKGAFRGAYPVFLPVYKDKDRRNGKTYVNVYQVKQYDIELVEVPVDIQKLHDDLKELVAKGPGEDPSKYQDSLDSLEKSLRDYYAK